MRTVVVITGASPLTWRALAAIPPGAILVAADGGLDHALDAGLEPSVLVGDLDSVSGASLAWATANAEVVRHAVAKDATDTELAVAHAATLGPDRLLLVAGGGDRIDHAIAALGSLGDPALETIPALEAWWGDDQVHVAAAPRVVTLDLARGTTFSVLALHGPCRGVTVTGARWPLDAHDLAPLVGLGVSNEALDPPVRVSATAGTFTVIVPGGL